EYVFHARIRHYGRFARLGHGDATRARCDLHLRDAGVLMRLGVRAQRKIVAFRIERHTRDVLLEPIEIDEYRGGVELVDGHCAPARLSTTRKRAFPLIIRSYASAARSSGNTSFIDRTPVSTEKRIVSSESRLNEFAQTGIAVRVDSSSASARVIGHENLRRPSICC